VREVITLQQTYRAGRLVIRMFCVDAVHIAAVERGEMICGHCGKPLFKSCIKRCAHGVYNPAGKSPCSLCKAYSLFEETEPTRKQAALLTTDPPVVRTSGVGKDRYTKVRINSSDQIVVRIKTMEKKEKENDAIPVRLDPHAFYSFKSPAMLSGYFEDTSDGDATRAKGYFAGKLRGEKPVETRTNEKTQCPAWILDTVSLREFVLTQQDSARAAAVLYLFYICSQTDGEIAARFGDGEESVKKYRQRLLRKGNAHFGVVTKAA
jgi:hypothetical protein